MVKELLRGLPSVDELMRKDGLKAAIAAHSRGFVASTIRETLERFRAGIISGKMHGVTDELIVESVLLALDSALLPSLRRVVNASGTVLHTNLGRAVLSVEAINAMVTAAQGPVNLEYDIERESRGERDSHVEPLIKRLTRAESATVVNNNAAALLIALNTLAQGKEVIVSRGELIEIGGSFRLPEIIEKSGCVLKEVGTTNRTHPEDYLHAIGPDTAVILKVHTSNYRVVGFSSSVGLKELVAMAREKGISIVEDLGSGSLVDLSMFNLPKEPLVAESIEAGVDVVTFSADKLLGGPQAGLLAGKKVCMDMIRKNPLKRALRVDKLTIASLEATLRLYLNEDTLCQRLPTLGFLARPIEEIDGVAEKGARLLSLALGPGYGISVEDDFSQVGSGSLPDARIETRVIAVTHAEKKPEAIFSRFLASDPPILGRIRDDRFVLDMRTVFEPEDVVPKARPG